MHVLSERHRFQKDDSSHRASAAGKSRVFLVGPSLGSCAARAEARRCWMRSLMVKARDPRRAADRRSAVTKPDTRRCSVRGCVGRGYAWRRMKAEKSAARAASVKATQSQPKISAEANSVAEDIVSMAGIANVFSRAADGESSAAVSEPEVLQDMPTSSR